MSDKVELVRMIRDAEAVGPTTADVHPNEVSNYRMGGWMVAPETPEVPQGDSAKKKSNRKAPEAPEAGN